jgi:hypothetical protein
VRILGTSPDAIDLAEDRERFSALLETLDISQPAHGLARTLEDARAIAARIGYPLLVRPSYVLGGRAMAIVYDDAQLEHFVARAFDAAPQHPVLIDRYLEDSTFNGHKLSFWFAQYGLPPFILLPPSLPAWRGEKGVRRVRWRAASPPATSLIPLLIPPPHAALRRGKGVGLMPSGLVQSQPPCHCEPRSGKAISTPQ